MRKHQAQFPQQDRTVDSLKRKFAVLHRKRIPTGDPAMPEDTRRAKHIRFKMHDRADLGEGDDINADEFFNEVDNEEPCLPTADGEENISEQPSLSGPPQTSSGSITEPRPLVHRRVGARHTKGEHDDLMSILKAQIIQDGIRREEEKERREQDRKEREQEHRMERERRAEDARRHDQIMQMVMMMMMSKGQMNELPKP